MLTRYFTVLTENLCENGLSGNRGPASVGLGSCGENEIRSYCRYSRAQSLYNNSAKLVVDLKGRSAYEVPRQTVLHHHFGL